MRNVYQIGGKVIEIDSIYEEVHTLCKGYICGQIPDFKVETSQSDIDFERKKSAAESRKEGIPCPSLHGRILGNSCSLSKDCRSNVIL